MASHNDLGNLGEVLATEYLIKQGYSILDKNWRYLKAEIDIIAQKENTLAIVEVKTRTTDFFGNPEEFITKGKIKLLIAATDAYVQQKNIDVEVRFDVIAIVKNNKETKLNHIKEAFLAFE
ncbi:YraN family protein [Wenyingzhuangia sp. 2_MG-2023]|uniref:YraN family protein n=1 Tax=Wenyingzhuangia sp. 2_MG-2023 TaxID=3062639 RepID=UPI0026E2BE23|nr:YraN family protein [Wenyingzhuangia sp. 2_MG-2023]MDO6736650.1 YraN family protein [Wenyingzhuangia sp. 2_MG-2023]MDO6801055.1 YraN family protein [Wenyingzhuangia sp. 1_MG-2023]